MSDLRRQFEDDGYVVLRGLLSPEEADHYRAEIQKISGLGDADFGARVFSCPDGVTMNRPFWPLISHDRLVDTIRALLGPTARYTQHSDLHAHRGTANWHRDSACRTFGVGPDWDETRAPYRVVRVAIYLQRYEESQSALGLIPGSHRFEHIPTEAEERWWRRIQRIEERLHRSLVKLGWADEPIPRRPKRRMIWTRPVRLPRLVRPTAPVWLKTEPGDCVIFNQRLYHASNRPKGPKYAVYLSYSPENEHGLNHLRYYRYVRDDLKYGPIAPELAELLKTAGLFLDIPPPEEFAGAWTPEASPSAHA